MVESVSSLSSLSYKKVVKPALFLFKPDFVHSALINVGGALGHVQPIRWLVREVLRYDNPQMLSQVVKGVYFPNPIGLSAGFDKNFQLLRMLPSIGFGFAECGSMSDDACDGNPRPHYHRLKNTQSIVVNAGLNNKGADVLIPRIASWQKHRKTWMPLNISVVKTNSKVSNTDAKGISKYAAVLKKIQKADVGDLITINVSCPNAYGGEPFTTAEKLENLLKEVDKLRLTKPVFLKMPSDKPWSEFKKMVEVALKHDVAGLTICNLAKDRTKAELKDPLDATVKGNLSGKPTWDLSNELISKTYAYAGDKLVIIGVGGVFSAEDAYEKIKRGATLVELITGMIFEGPAVIGKINAGLAELAKNDGYTNISQAIGAYHRN